MKRLMTLLGLVFVLLVSTSIQSNAQDDNTKNTADEITVYHWPPIVEDQPTFIGGGKALYQWLSEHVNYPEEALADSVQGKVIVEFDVNQNGEIEKPRIRRGCHPALEKEAIRVFKEMPKWKPAEKNGKPVSVTSCLPITFKLSDEQSDIAKEHDSDNTAEDLKVYSFNEVDMKPEFPGGTEALYKWICSNLKYPATTRDPINNVERIVVEFTISKNGEIEDPCILRGILPALDKEALRVVKALPKWKPGMHNGQIVRTRYKLPIIIKHADVAESSAE